MKIDGTITSIHENNDLVIVNSTSGIQMFKNM